MKIISLLIFFLLNIVLAAQDDVSSLVATMLTNTPLEEDLQELCDDIGGRVTGSRSNMDAVEWAFDKFTKAGVMVQKHDFEMPVLWLEESCTAEISGDVSFSPSIVSKYQSPPGIYHGEMVYLPLEGINSKIVQSIKDKIVIVSSDLCFDINGLFQEYIDATTVENYCIQHGAKGIIFMSSRPKGLLYRFITSKGTDNNLLQLVMSREDANRCIRSLSNGIKLSISINLKATTGENFTSTNIIGEIKGSVHPEEVIIIGSHLDSWALGTGANDNGCNVSMLIDIARQMKALGVHPKRTIRFALWNGEEQGYFGSWAYCKDHQSEIDNHKMAISIDIGSGDIIGFFTNGRNEIIPVLNKLLDPVIALGPFNNVNSPIIGTDNFDFMLEGVANLVGIHKAATYGLNYHAASDTYDKVDLVSLKKNSAIVGAVILGLANISQQDMSWLRHNRSQIISMVEDFNLEYQMRMFNVWTLWQNGKRGRK